jgi:hypothetical protein
MAHGPQYKVSPFIIRLAYVEALSNAPYGMPAQFTLAFFQGPLQPVIADALRAKYCAVRDSRVFEISIIYGKRIMDQDKAIQSCFPATVNLFVRDKISPFCLCIVV